MTIHAPSESLFKLDTLTDAERAALEDAVSTQQSKIPLANGEQSSAIKVLRSVLFQFRVALTASKEVISFLEVKEAFLSAITQGSTRYSVSEEETSRAIRRLEQAWIICIRFLQHQLLMLRAQGKLPAVAE